MRLGPFMVFLFMFLIVAFMFADIQDAILAATFTDDIGVIVGYMPHTLIVVSVVCMIYFGLEGRNQ